MRALSLLYKSGLTRSRVAEALDCSSHAIGLYERGERFPRKEPYEALVVLAESRGMTLLARDFLENGAANNGSDSNGS